MHSWSNKLHSATQSLLTAVIDLHGTSKNDITNQNGLMLRLVTSVSDIAHLVEQLNADHRCLEKELRREKEASAKMTARLEALEQRYREFERVTSRPQTQERGQETGEASVNSGGSVGDVASGDDVCRQRESTQESRQSKLAEPNEELPTTPPRTPPPPSSPPQQESISPYKPLPPKQLPPLPTLREVEAEQRQRRSQKRTLASQKPPPCEKCRVRKRADMLRDEGRVKEDVFMRWSKRPGGCLQFMHYDEPIPEGAGSELSFPDTETQPPE